MVRQWDHTDNTSAWVFAEHRVNKEDSSAAFDHGMVIDSMHIINKTCLLSSFVSMLSMIPGSQATQSKQYKMVVLGL